MTEFKKFVRRYGSSWFISLDKDIRDIYSIDEDTLVTFEIKKVEKVKREGKEETEQGKVEKTETNLEE